LRRQQPRPRAQRLRPADGLLSRDAALPRFAESPGLPLDDPAARPHLSVQDGLHLWSDAMTRLPAALALLMLAAVTVRTEDYPANYVAATLVRLNDNGAWSWFMDPRVIVNDGKLIVGSVRAVGSNQANVTDPRWGNVEISVYDLATAKVDNVVLHPHLEQDDHDGPAFLVRKDGRYLAVYSKHTKE